MNRLPCPEPIRFRPSHAEGLPDVRDRFHRPPDRFCRWYMDPPLQTCMPEDEPARYADSYFYRIQLVRTWGGYTTFDLG